VSYELRTIPGCPHSGQALKLFRTALLAEGIDPELATVLELTSEAEAAAVDFHGSPTFTADGQDLFPSAAAAALTCRVYPTDRGLAGLPSIESLRTAVRSHNADA